MHIKLSQCSTGDSLAIETGHGDSLQVQPPGEPSFEQAIKAYSRGAQKFRGALADLAQQTRGVRLTGATGDCREEDLE